MILNLKKSILKLFKPQIIKNLNILAEVYERMEASVQRILVLSELDVRKHEKFLLQHKFQHLSFLNRIEAAGVRSCISTVEADDTDAKLLARLYMLSSAQIRKVTKEESEVAGTLEAYEDYTDLTLETMKPDNQWVN